jgi:2-polyprenyl-6-methoxyphenol hydroxylase-like FAD-dependent oxidoreductase
VTGLGANRDRAPSQPGRVIVVGGGPVGLALAIELGWRNVPVLLVDETGGSVVFPAGV